MCAYNSQLPDHQEIIIYTDQIQQLNLKTGHSLKIYTLLVIIFYIIIGLLGGVFAINSVLGEPLFNINVCS